MDRRATLAWLGAAIALPVIATRLYGSFAGDANAELTLTGTAPTGYGLDPDLVDPIAPWPRIMTPLQKQQISVLADIFLPKTPEYPAPSEVGIPDFVDEWISAPYPEQVSDRSLFVQGLAWMEAESQRRWETSFLSLHEDQQTSLLQALSVTPTNPASPEAESLHNFFRRLRNVVVGSYYSLESNFAEIGYIGNIAQETFPPPTAEENAFIDRAISKLTV